MLKKVILCPNPYRDAQLRVAKEAKRVLDEVGCPNVVCLPFRNQEKPEGYGLSIEPLQQELRGADMIIANGKEVGVLHQILEDDFVGTVFKADKKDDFFIADFIEENMN